MTENLKEVRFDKYCVTCKHDKPNGMLNPDIGYNDGEHGWTGVTTKEEIVPCCYCLEEGVVQSSACIYR